MTQTKNSDSWFAPKKIQDRHPIIFFDGICNLCNHFIRWVMDHDPTGIHHVASLQGETGQRLIGAQAANSLTWSMVLVDEEGQHRKSKAVFKILFNLGGGWKLLACSLSWIPRTISDTVYDFIARNRYRWFGQRDSCRVPTPEERGRFLP